ncbi:MAG TPA: response regulator transcription factor [Thermoleophilaceae bacterium]|nr:response regulator transcription factor [Thermoleophilaceae bacterium]
MATSRVVLADDHPCYRQGLAKMLRDCGVEVVAEAGNGWAALQAAENAEADVIMLDLGMPGLSGAEVTRRLTSCDPPHRVLILSVSDSEADVVEALHAGATGYFLKDGPVEEVVAGIRAVAAGESSFSPRIGAMLLRRVRETEERPAGAPVALSPRERDVLRLVVEGRSNEKIGEGLSIDAGTARNHVSHILAKMGVDNRVQAAVRAVREDLV